MAGFLYFVPAGEKLPEEFENRCSNSITEVSAGPTEKPGCVRGGHSYDKENTAHEIKYFKDKQTWTQLDGCECWVGVYNDRPPVPSELERSEMLPGHDVDGWSVPYARTWSDHATASTSLPRYVKKTSGNWNAGDVVNELLHFEEVATILFDWWIPQPTVVKYDFAMPHIMTALAVNYHIGPDELSLMKPCHAIRSDRVADYVGAILNAPMLNDILNKKKHDT